jgi:ketosteroid isomerase-like protein
MRTALTVLALLLSFPLAAQDAPVAHPSVELPPQLERVLRDYEKAWQAKDAAALAKLFTDDGFVLSNGKPPVRGRAAIEEAYRGAGGPLSLRALAYNTDGTLGYIIGAFSQTKGTPDQGKFILTLHRVDDRWMIVADMDNSIRRPSKPN